MSATMTKAQELMEKSFAHHDKNNNGVLEKEEAALFFKHILDENGALMQHMNEFGIRTSTEKMVQAFKDSNELDESLKAETIATMKTSVQAMVEESRKNIEKSMEEYKANKEERDAAAFAIVD